MLDQLDSTKTSFEVACSWLQGNDKWMTWLPEKGKCNPQFGIYDESLPILDAQNPVLAQHGNLGRTIMISLKQHGIFVDISCILSVCDPLFSALICPGPCLENAKGFKVGKVVTRFAWVNIEWW